MKNKPIIIEFTWLQWSWKTTVLNEIKKQYNFNNDVLIFDEEVKKKYLNETKIKRLIYNFFNLILNPLLYINILLLCLKSKSEYKSFFWNFILLSTNYTLYKYINKNYNNKAIIFDEFLLHQLLSVSYNIKNRDKYIKNTIKHINLYPIFFDTSIEISLERTKNRNKAIKFDNLTDWEKRKLLEKNWYLSKYIVEKYCELTNKPYLEVDGDASIEEKTRQVMKHIEYIMEITNN